MIKRTVYVAELLAPGIVVAVSSTEPMSRPDPMLVEWPASAYAFRIIARDQVVDGSDVYSSAKSTQIGPTYYHPDSRVETLEEVRRNPAATRTLLTNMECNGWAAVVWSRWGNWPQPFDPERDAVLPKISEEIS